MDCEKYKFIHTSDWHLGAPVNWVPYEKGTGRWIGGFRSCREKAIENIVEEAIKNKVVAILVAGDVTDTYGYSIILEKINNFLRQKVIIPLSQNGIKLFLTSGSHDHKTTEAIQFLLSLKRNYQETLEFLIPEKLKHLFGRTSVQSSTTYKDLIISCEEPAQICKWIAFKHEESDFSSRNLPIYRAFGDKHILTCKNRHTYFPGTPFARSSASDNQYTDVGPRYCLLYTVGENKPERLKLKVPEVVVLKKKFSENKWELIYKRNYERNSWETTIYEEPVDVTLRRIKDDLPDVFFITLVLDKNEEDLYSHQVMINALSLVKDRKKVIEGSRKGIVTVMIRELNIFK